MFEFFLRPVRLERKLDEVLRLLSALKLNQHRQGKKLMADLSKITANVAANGSVIGSAITLINQLAEELRNIDTDQGAIDALANDLEAQAAALADAVLRNTPAAPSA